MIRGIPRKAKQFAVITLGVGIVAALGYSQTALAITPIPTPDPIPGSYGLEATKPKAPPTKGATITIPGNGSSFKSSPTEVKGICPSGLLVEIYDNGVMVGAVMCKDGSFSLKVSLFAGKNQLTAMVYDSLGQTGPKSKTVTVTYTDTSLTSFGELVTLTSQYGRRSSAAGTSLKWPLQLSGGAGPYAFSIDWGDGSKPELKSQSLAGLVGISHVYKNAGIYLVNIQATDSNGVSAFLQLVAVSSGKPNPAAANSKGNDKGQTIVKTRVLWIPLILMLILLLPAYWLGRRSQLISIRNKMLKDRDSYENQ